MPRMVTVLYFAVLRELVGVDEETMALQEGLRTVGHLKAHLQRVHPSLEGKLGRVRFARNEVFAPEETILEEGDVIALIPPVAGG